jgi:hypothetical protein
MPALLSDRVKKKKKKIRKPPIQGVTRMHAEKESERERGERNGERNGEKVCVGERERRAGVKTCMQI